MNKYIKLISFCILTILILGLIGCTDISKRAPKAIYLAPENGGQLAKEEIEKYPEVVSVTSFNELKRLVSKRTIECEWINIRILVNISEL